MQYPNNEEQKCSNYIVGSYPKDFRCEYDENEDCSILNESKPRILLVGLRRSGKSSILKVVFHKMAPNETLFLESTSKIIKDNISNSCFVQFEIWDFPGQGNYLDGDIGCETATMFGQVGALIFIIDAQDEYQEALRKLHQTVSFAYKVNPSLHFEVFIHKVDGLSDDLKMEIQRDIVQKVSDDMKDESRYHRTTMKILNNVLAMSPNSIGFYLTSIYDHSIFEAFSKVVQKLIPQMATLENLLNVFISNSCVEKAFLFDVVSKIYVATDSAPVDMQSYELCCDMIDVVIDISCIYGVRNDDECATFDNQSSSIIRLNQGTRLYLREVNKLLALVCILREESCSKQGLIEYNFLCFRDAIEQIFAICSKTQSQGKSS